MNRRLIAASLGVWALAMVAGGVAARAFDADASDQLVPTDGAIHPSLVVISFDGRRTGAGELPFDPRSIFNITELLDRGALAGVRAVVVVGFDTLTVIDPENVRTAVSSSKGAAAVGIVGVHDVALRSGSPLPTLVRYRVDSLASLFAGVGLPIPANTSGLLRLVPVAAYSKTLTNGDVSLSNPVQINPGDYPNVITNLGVRLASSLDDYQPIAMTADGMINLGAHRVPLEDGNLRVHWSNGLNDIHDPAVIPIGDAAQHPELFRGKIVIAGITDPTRAPSFDTPVGQLPETFVQANIVNTILNANYLRTLSGWWETSATVAASLLVLGLWRRHRLLGLAAAVVSAVGWVWLASRLANNGRLLGPLGPPVAVTVALAGAEFIRQFAAARDRLRLTRMFSQYVPPAIARGLIESGRAGLADDGERLTVTVLFCDLRGFTAISTVYSPPVVREMLDHYYEELSQIVFDHAGSVLQYTGDEIFAAFGAPLPLQDHASAALACARDMFAALPNLNTLLVERGLPPVNFGIGVHTGLVIGANVGSKHRRQYALVGETVNIANRFCNLAREGQVTFSATAKGDETAVDAVELGEVQLKGITTPMAAYCLQIGPHGTSGSDQLAAELAEIAPRT